MITKGLYVRFHQSFGRMDSNAKAYDTLRKPQYDIGCIFLDALIVSPGDKVVDMGCGTGQLTKFIADMVKMAR